MKRFIIKTFDLEKRLSKMKPENRFFLALGIATLLGLILPLTVLILFYYLPAGGQRINLKSKFGKETDFCISLKLLKINKE